MDTTRFHDDLIRIPDSLDALGETVLSGLPGLERLPSATAILVLGMGSSAYAAQSIAREARSSGLPVTVELASATLLPAPSPELVVIAISATGGSLEVLAAARRYAGIGRLIAITNNSDSALADLADVVIPLLAGTELSGIACRTFRHTFIVLAEVLTRYGAVFETGPSDLCRAAAAANTALLESSPTWLEPVAHTLLGPSGTFVLAPADRFASAQQSSLMMREVPRRPAYASETGDWSHVDVYLTKTLDYRALVYAGSAWDDQAMEWMRERGSTVVSVGAALPLATNSVRYPGEDDRLTASLTEMLVGELVAWRWYQADPDFSWSRHA